MEPIDVACSKGALLTFDGRVLEFFDDRTRVSDWRIHVGHIVGWEVEPRKGLSLVRVMVGKKNWQNFPVDDDQMPAFDHLRQAVDAARA